VDPGFKPSTKGKKKKRKESYNISGTVEQELGLTNKPGYNSYDYKN
jgi:hypothetical protein